MGIRVWLDDTRPCPEGWVHCRWPEEVIELLEAGNVEAMSLDHDLGEDSSYAHPRTGMVVVNWLEEAVLTQGFPLPRVAIHTDNAVAGPIMKRTIQRLKERSRHAGG